MCRLNGFKIALLTATVAAFGCGGGDILGSLLGFQPRAAFQGDLANRRFDFAAFPTGNPISNETDAFSIEFGTFTNSVTPFGLVESDGGVANGTARLDQDTLTLTVTSVTGDIALTNGQVKDLLVEAEQEGARIRLTDTGRNAAAISTE